MPALAAVSKLPVSPLDKVLRRIHEVSTLPQIALRVMEVANQPDSRAGDLKRILEADAALSARVLRCVNSSAYALRVRITNLQQAIAYLGLKQIRNLAMTASVAEMFKSKEAIGPYCRAQLWRHLVSVGICARMIAKRLRLANFEDLFLAGLLHDLGIALEDQYLHGPFGEVIRSLRPGDTLIAAEQARLGFDHAVLGQRVAESWGFPEPIRAAIGHHHAAARYGGPEPEVVRCIDVANLLCTFQGIPSVGMKLVTGSRQVLEALGLSKDDLVVMAGDLERELASHADLFQL
jgi:putative nucleotidyltransferase with HDIG domain